MVAKPALMLRGCGSHRFRSYSSRSGADKLSRFAYFGSALFMLIVPKHLYSVIWHTHILETNMDAIFWILNTPNFPAAFVNRTTECDPRLK
jgi:hypothetical protein